MVVKKGCFNEKCIARKKKLKWKAHDDIYCSKCANELDYVCASRGCYERLENDNERYCPKCIEKQEERKRNAIKAAKSVPIAIGTTAAAIVAVAKDGPEVIKAGKKIVKMIPKK